MDASFTELQKQRAINLEMLEALEGLDEIINPGTEELAAGFNNGHWLGAMNNIRAAIQKARGGQ